MPINFKSSPYFDDFDSKNNFFKILFKPGYAVQTRELNQIQSIVLNQLATFGKHIFQKNSVIIPGSIVLNNNADILQINNIDDPSVLLGKTITNAPNFDVTDDTSLDGYITAVVLAVTPSKDKTNPSLLYLKYFKTQKNPNGTFRHTFSVDDNQFGLKTVDTSIISFNVHPNGASIGKVVVLDKGTFFTKDLFVEAPAQSLILEIDNQTVTNAVIGLDIQENIITSDMDQSLLDNSSGSINQYAPGADRYQITLKLNKYTKDTIPADERFIFMMSIEDNTITYVNSDTQYADIMKMMAQRMYDANGNFIVTGMDTVINESDDKKSLWATVNPGNGYLGGYRYNQIAKQTLVIDKPRDEKHQELAAVVKKYADAVTYFYVPGGTLLKQIPEINSLVQFLDAAPFVKDAKIIGYGIFRDIQYAFGDVNDQKSIYRMYFDNISFEKGFAINNIGGIRTIINGEGVPILHALGITNIINGSKPFTLGNQLVAGADTTQSGLLYQFLNNVLYLIKDSKNNIPNLDTIKDLITGTTATRKSTFISNHTDDNIPLYEIDKDTIKTLYTPSDQNIPINKTTFTITSRDIFVNISEGTNVSPQLSGNDRYADISPYNYIAAIVDSPYENTVDLISEGLITVDTLSGSRSYTITLPQSHPLIGRTLWVYSTIVRENVVESKKLISSPKTIVFPCHTASTMWLEDQDIIDVSKITEGRTMAIYYDADQPKSIEYIASDKVFQIHTVEAHGLLVGDKIAIKEVQSKNYPDSNFKHGFNGVFTVSEIDSELTFRAAYILPEVTFDQATSIDVSTGIFTSYNHPFKPGDAVILQQLIQNNPEPKPTDKPITPIVGIRDNSPNKPYYIIFVSSHKFQLAESYDDFLKNNAVSITEMGNGKTTISVVEPGEYIPGTGYVALPPNITNDNDVTKRYRYDTGQSHSLVTAGNIKLKKDSKQPIGQLAVQYTYYSTTSTGSYISVDSYGDSTQSLDYIGQIKDVLSPRKAIIPIRNYFDFRTRTSNFYCANVATIASEANLLFLKDLNLQYLQSKLIGKYIVGPSHISGTMIINMFIHPMTGDTVLVLDTLSKKTSDGKPYTGIYYIGLSNQSGTDLTITASGTAGDSSYRLPRANYLLSYRCIKFTPKQTLIYLHRVDDRLSLDQMEVQSLDDANKYRRDAFYLPLAYVRMDPYCIGISNIRLTKYENPRYTMLDIYDIAKKVDRMEYYTSLALNSNLSTDLFQAGNQDYTSSFQGFWNEDFDDASTQELTDPDYSCTLYDKSHVAPGVITKTIDLDLDKGLSTNYQQSGSCITLPFVEQLAISQTLASRYNNLNPYHVVNWAGKMVLSPAVDNWVDTTVSPIPIALPATPETPTPPAAPVYNPPEVQTEPVTLLPLPSSQEYLMAITNLKTNIGPDSWGCHHGISFDWKTSTGRSGHVNTDIHESAILRRFGKRGFNGDYAKSLIGKKYTDFGVKMYLHAGQHNDYLIKM